MTTRRMRCLILFAAFIAAPVQGQQSENNWPAFRGLNASGLSPSKTQTDWNVNEAKNIKWTVPIPGLAHSCPIIWDNLLFVTTAVTESGDTDVKTGLYGDIEPVENETVHEWILYCLDKNTGKIKWKKVSHRGIPQVKRHPKSSHANPTPVTDGKHVVAFYGSEGLFCYDMNGNLLWEKNFGILNATFYRVPSAQWGFASSPIIHDGVLILQVDVLENSFLAAYEISTGEELWKTPRTDVPTWCTPSIYTFKNDVRIAVNGYQHIGGYDFKTGKNIWTMKEGGDIPVPAPVVGKDLIFFTSAHGKLRPIYAVKTAATGDISLTDKESSNEFIAWSGRKNGAYMPTPIVVGDYFYRLQDTGRFACFKQADGTLMYEQKLEAPGWITASPVASKNAIYCMGERGDVFVIKPGPEFEMLAQNHLEDNCLATPAISEGVIYFRTQHALIAVDK